MGQEKLFSAVAAQCIVLLIDLNLGSKQPKCLQLTTSLQQLTTILSFNGIRSILANSGIGFTIWDPLRNYPAAALPVIQFHDHVALLEGVLISGPRIPKPVRVV